MSGTDAASVSTSRALAQRQHVPGDDAQHDDERAGHEGRPAAEDDVEHQQDRGRDAQQEQREAGTIESYNSTVPQPSFLGSLLATLLLTAGVSDEPSTYGMPDAQGSRYAFIEAAIMLERTHPMTFLKLTAGVFAGVFIAFLTFFYDSNDRGAFGGKLGLLVGVLFAVVLNMRNADTSIGDIDDLTLVTELHLITLALIVVLALAALRDRRRVERGLPVRHPDWRLLCIIGSLYVLVMAALILQAAGS